MSKLVLLYHHITPADDSEVSPVSFQKQLNLLLDQNYRIFPLSQYFNADENDKAAFITFDDGYHTIYEYALPILKEMNLPAAVFLITDYINDWNQWEKHRPRANHLTDAQIDELCSLGWEMHSHTAAHENFETLSTGAIHQDVHRATKCLRRWNTGELFCAYPYGRSEPRLIEALKQAGYTGAFIAQSTWPQVDPYRIPRLPVTENTSLIDEGKSEGKQDDSIY